MWEKIQFHEDWQREPFRRFLAYHALKLGTGPLPQESKDRVRAEVNHGRWIAHCPVEGCGGALVVSETDLVFFCVYCGNADNLGKFYNVQFPSQRKAIEEALMKRPLVARQPTTRNWLPTESVGDLIKENRARGID